MNWLIYICGGIIFCSWVSNFIKFMFKFEFENGVKIELNFSGLVAVPAWIWICWKLIP